MMCPSASASNRTKKKRRKKVRMKNNSIFLIKIFAALQVCKELFKQLWDGGTRVLPGRVACGITQVTEDSVRWKWLFSLTIEKAVLQIVFVYMQYSRQTVNITDCKLIGKWGLCCESSVKRERWVPNEDKCWHRGFGKFSEALALRKRHRSQIHSCRRAVNLRGPWHQGWIWPTYQKNSIFILL